MHQLVVFLIFTFVFGCQCYESGKRSFRWDENPGQQWDLQAQVSKILTAQPGQGPQIDAWNDYASSTPEVVPFQNKIFERLDKSQILFNKPEMHQNLLRMALEKMKTCKPLRSNQMNVDRSCFGHSTGQIMQLIAGVENARPNVHQQRW